MDGYIARANIDHYITLLNGGDLTLQNRSTITKLLIAEEDKLSHDLEHLEFAEIRAAKSQHRVGYFRKLRDSFVEGSTERAHADGVLENFEVTHSLMVQFCHRLREKVNSSGL